jgi:recombination protein RecR
MPLYIKYIENLINEFKRIPGIGPKSAKRIVYWLLKQPVNDIERFASALSEMRTRTKFCSLCFNISEEDICGICSDPTRDSSRMCIVEEIKDVAILESTGQFKGLYHVLGGLLSPIDDIGPEEIKIPQLLNRIKNSEIEEVVIALNNTVEGESTAAYIKKILGQIGIKVTRPASGLPVGADLEYTDEITLSRALRDRVEF